MKFFIVIQVITGLALNGRCVQSFVPTATSKATTSLASPSLIQRVTVGTHTTPKALTVKKSSTSLHVMPGVIRTIGRRLEANPAILLVATVVTIVGERIVFKQRRFELQIANELLSSTVSAPSSSSSLIIQPRDDLTERLREAVTNHSSALLVGGRGCGKMTLVRQTFEDQEGIVEVRMPVEPLVDYTDVILESIGILPGMPLLGALERIKSKEIEKPTILLRLDKRPSPGQLKRLLEWTQSFSGLADMVLYVPDSRVADFVEVDCDLFGAKIVDVDMELTQCQALAALRDVARSNDEATEYIGKVGLHPQVLSELANVMSTAGPNSETRAEKLANFVDEKRNSIQFIVRGIVRNKKFAKMPDEAKKLFTKMSMGHVVTFDQIRTAMEMTDSTEFFGVDKLAPHVFRVNADDGKLSFTSALARVTFMDQIQVAV